MWRSVPMLRHHRKRLVKNKTMKKIILVAIIIMYNSIFSYSQKSMYCWGIPMDNANTFISQFIDKYNNEGVESVAGSNNFSKSLHFTGVMFIQDNAWVINHPVKEKLDFKCHFLCDYEISNITINIIGNSINYITFNIGDFKKKDVESLNNYYKNTLKHNDISIADSLYDLKWYSFDSFYNNKDYEINKFWSICSALTQKYGNYIEINEYEIGWVVSNVGYIVLSIITNDEDIDEKRYYCQLEYINSLVYNQYIDDL